MSDSEFYLPGHVYGYAVYAPGYDWKFRADVVTTRPEDGERVALGWRFFRGEWEPIAYGEDDWAVHSHDPAGPLVVQSVPVGPEPQPRTMLDHARDALNARMTKDDLRLVLENVVAYATSLESRLAEDEAPFTEARAAFMQMGTTPSLEGLRAELRIEGKPPLVGRYVGASAQRLHDVPGCEHLLAIDPRLIFEYAETDGGGE